MMRRKFLSLVAGALLLLTTGLVGTVAASTATAASSNYGSTCYNWQNWTTGSENNFTMSSDLVKDFRAGRQLNCDRLVFVLSGGANVGYYAGYGATYQPNDARVPVDGPVDFNLVIRAWPKGWNTTSFYDDFAVKPNTVIYPASNPKGLKVVCQIKAAGGFEGETTFAIGLKKKTQWRLFTARLADGSRAVIVEFAHTR